ncbi:BAG family molecular chaperone regulator 3-like [Dendronephthya gigantea]|uniref:BAG family molecular chaperone regulator 3-like n=1 Tax=Dendronephthya gigantea TaxID=151771 RepID=UPI00106B33F7|nr:BAG family molecular chaperone regulator 3-like [Dendronephthya gigantea]
MSYDIPITFDDFPFFGWGEMRRPQERYHRRGKREPSVFGDWVEPEFSSEYPRRKHHFSPNYGERQRENKMRSGRDHIFEDEGEQQEDIYDNEEQRRMKGKFGYDGWDIPVQYVDRPGKVHHKHKHKHKPKSGKIHQHINDNSKPAESVQPQQKINQGEKKPEEIPSGTQCSNEENKTEVEKTTKEDQNMEQQSNISSDNEGLPNTTETSSQTSESGNSESTEIPITFSRPKKTQRRPSKRLSQCDPPSPADIKISRIKSIVEKTEGMDQKIAEFIDPVQNKNYLYISETLMKILLDLDTVDSEGLDVVRKARKEGVQTVQALVTKLENKLEENKRT